MTIAQRYAGCDVSKAHLDVAIIEDGGLVLEKRFANTALGIGALIRALIDHRASLIVYEPSGGYERALAQALTGARLPARRMNARQIRDFAKGLGLLAKTDAIDARVLARYAAQVRPEARAPARQAVQELQAFVRRRAQLVEARKREKQRLEAAVYDDLRRDLEEEIERLTDKIKKVETKIRSLIEKDDDLARRAGLLISVKGLGPVSVAILLAEAPELGAVTGKAAANLLGVAPHACDSGALRGRRRCYGGRKQLRDALYMPALSACRSTPRWKRVYQRLIDAGKPHKVALIAVMRRMIETFNAMIRDDKIFQM